MKMQAYKFRNIDEMLDFLPPEERAITLILRNLILDTIPNIKEKLSYNVPFYSLHKSLCHIWPGSVSWGNKTFEGVSLGFSYGNLLLDEENYLEKGNRKQVYMKTFYQKEDINIPLMKSYLYEAALLDEQVFKGKGN